MQAVTGGYGFSIRRRGRCLVSDMFTRSPSAKWIVSPSRFGGRMSRARISVGLSVGPRALLPWGRDRPSLLRIPRSPARTTTVLPGLQELR